MGTTRGLSSEILSDSPFPQLGKTHRATFPLLPDHRPQAVSGPLFKTFQHGGGLTVAKISDPAAKIAAQFFGHFLHFYPSGSARDFPNSSFKPKHRFGRDTPLGRLVPRKAKAQKLPFPWSRHRALLFVNLELELRRDELLQT